MERSLSKWAGTNRAATLAIVFTDILGSTALGNELGSEELTSVRNIHYSQARRLVEVNDGYEIKTIGDAFMVAFHTALSALNFALSLHDFTGHESIEIRAGINVGAVQIVENDLVGGPVNLASRLVSWRKDDWIIVSDRAKDDIEGELGARSEHFSFFCYEADLKDFPLEKTIWRVEYREDFSAREITSENLTTYLRHRFFDRVHADAKSIAQLADQLKAGGYLTLGDIEQVREKGWQAFLAYEPRRFVGRDLILRASNKDSRLSDVGLIRSLIYIVDENFRASSGDHFSASQLERINEARTLLRR
jgi:class 3 adenylate cyclase